MVDSLLLGLGEVPYEQAWDIQRRLGEMRASGTIPDVLILLEHPHTYTLGRSGHIENLLMSEQERQEKGVTVLEVDRGGDITYHGPGQLVIYPIRFLGVPGADGRLPKVDYVGYIRMLEETLIRTLAAYNVNGYRIEGLTGVWVDTVEGQEKIAAIGVRVNSKGISSHGAALNVNPDLSYFAGIVPCGITDKGVTSLQKLLGAQTPPMHDVVSRYCACFSEVFEVNLHQAEAAALLG